MFRKISYLLYSAFLLSVVVLPMLIIISYAFTNSQWEITGNNFVKAFTHPNYFDIFTKSLRISFTTTFWALIIAYPVAYYISKCSKKSQRTLIVLFIAPIWTNFVLRTYAWIKILGQNGFINSFLKSFGVDPIQFLYNEHAVTFGMIYNLLPFMILPIYNALIKIDPIYLEAAYDLGASPFYTFYKIILPLSLSGIRTGILMVFIPALTLFAVSDLLGGAKNLLIGNLISQAFFLMRDWHFGSALSILLIAIILFSVFILNLKNMFHKKKEWHFE